MKEKKSERLQLRLTSETLRRLRLVCGFYGCHMSEWFEKKVDDEYMSQVNLFELDDLSDVCSEIYKGVYDNETA